MSKEVQKKGIKRERDEIINENIYDPRLITQESMDVSSSQIDKKIKTEKKVKIEKVKTENCQNVETSTERERRLTLARNCLEEISEKTGCSVKIVLHALWVNSGNLQDALDYLTTDDYDENKIWTPEQDKAIFKDARSSTFRKLVLERGMEEINKRKEFLQNGKMT